MPPNSWNDYVKKRSKTSKQSPSQLSHLYRNHMAQLVTVHIDYIHSLHQKVDELSRECILIKNQNAILLNILTYDEPLFETQP